MGTKQPSNPSWGSNLEKEIKARYSSKRKAAKILGVKQNTLSTWCYGAWPGETEARRIADLMGVDYGALVADNIDKTDDAIMEIAIRVAHDVIAETMGTVDAATNAKLVGLAYTKLKESGKPWDLPVYVKSLISLIAAGKPG